MSNSKLILSKYALLISILAFFALIIYMHIPQLLKLDSSILLQIHHKSKDSWVYYSKFLNAIGEPVVMIPIIILTPVVLYIYKKYYESVIAASILLSSSSAQWLIKLAIGRHRPSLWKNLIIESGSSFPSGHTTIAAAFWMTSSVIFWKTSYRYPVFAIGAIYTFLMAFSRLVLGVHFPTDVLAGILLATIATLGSLVIMSSARMLEIVKNISK